MDVIGSFSLVWLLTVVLEIVLVITALMDVARRSMDPLIKLVWVLVILAFPIIGSIAELIVNRSGTMRTA